MKQLYDVQKLILEQFDPNTFYNRALFSSITLDNAATGILGSRGVGKTTYLLHQVMTHNQKAPRYALYVSADNPFFLEHSLLDVVDYLYKETDTQLLCIDEIHKYPNWQQTLKNIADIYKKIKILFTGSSMIDIVHSQFDLSRRVTLHYLGGLSFREYLEFYLGQKISPIHYDTLLKDHQSFADSLTVTQILKHFRQYLTSGYYFFSKDLSIEANRFQAIENITQKIIYEDIALLHQLKTASLHNIENTYKFILNSTPGELNTNKLAGLVSKSYDQTLEYITWLEQSGLIHALYPQKRGKAFIKSPKKLLPENTNLMHAAYIPIIQDDIIGKIRETFFVNQFKNAKQKIFYSEVGDFQVDETVFEIGGKNKTSKQIQGKQNAFIAADDIVVGAHNTIPLYLFGFLY